VSLYFKNGQPAVIMLAVRILIIVYVILAILQTVKPVRSASNHMDCHKDDELTFGNTDLSTSEERSDERNISKKR